MPRFEFFTGPRDSIMWSFNREPEIGEEIILGDRGVFRVTGVRLRTIASVAETEYEVERVRDATHQDLDAMLKRGVDRLP